MPEQPEPQQPHEPRAPEGKAGVLAWFFRFFERAAESKNAPSFVALSLTAAIVCFAVWQELRYAKVVDGIKEQHTENQGALLRHFAERDERNLRAVADENDKAREHDKYRLEIQVRDMKEDRKALTQISIALGILSKTVEARLASVEDAISKVLRYLKPNQTLFEFVPDLFRRVTVAPMPRAIAEPSCTGPRASTSAPQQPGVGRP